MVLLDLPGRDVGDVSVDAEIGGQQVFHEVLKDRQTGNNDGHDIIHSAPGCDAQGDFVNVADVGLEPVEIRSAMMRQRDGDDNLGKVSDPIKRDVRVIPAYESGRFQPGQSLPARCRRQVHDLGELRFAQLAILLQRAEDTDIGRIKSVFLAHSELSLSLATASSSTGGKQLRSRSGNFGIQTLLRRWILCDYLQDRSELMAPGECGGPARRGLAPQITVLPQHLRVGPMHDQVHAEIDMAAALGLGRVASMRCAQIMRDDQAVSSHEGALGRLVRAGVEGVEGVDKFAVAAGAHHRVELQFSPVLIGHPCQRANVVEAEKAAIGHLDDALDGECDLLQGIATWLPQDPLAEMVICGPGPNLSCEIMALGQAMVSSVQIRSIMAPMGSPTSPSPMIAPRFDEAAAANVGSR